MPAALTTPSMPPIAAAPCSTACATDASCVTSASAATPPVSRATSASLFRSQSSKVRAAPSAANSSAVRRPIPEAAPVIRIRRPLRRSAIYSLLFCRCPLDDRRRGRGLPGLYYRQDLLGEEPHRFLGDRERDAAKTERGGELECAYHPAPLLEHAQDAVGRPPHRGLHKALGHPFEPGLADDLGFLRVGVVTLHGRKVVAHQL